MTVADRAEPSAGLSGEVYAVIDDEACYALLLVAATNVELALVVEHVAVFFEDPFGQSDRRGNDVAGFHLFGDAL